MRDAADCNSVKTCFPVAVIYFAVEGMISWGVSDDSWIQMCVREMGGKESILSHRRLWICLHNSVLHRGIFLRYRDDSFRQFLDAYVCQRLGDGRIRIILSPVP